MPYLPLTRRVIVLLGLLLSALGPAALGQDRAKTPAELPIPSLDSITRADRGTRPSRAEMESCTFIVKTEPHPVKGDAYVIVTDHDDKAYLAALERLAKHHAGTILRVADLSRLHATPGARDQLVADLRKARPRFVAIAPRLENFRENMLLGMWEILSSLDPDPQLDVFPGLLVAPSAKAFDALIDRSIRYQPPRGDALRPFVVGQVTDSSVTGMRSLQKVGIMRAFFDQYGRSTPSLVTRTFQARRADGNPGGPQEQWEVTAEAPRQFITALPPPAKQALDEASLLVMFGHGVPGMTCSLDVGAFHNVRMTDKVVLCGSCMSAAPIESDFPPMRTGPDGSAVRNDKERFVMRAVESGAVVVYAHMRLNAGFPHIYPVLECWTNGLTVGEAYQRLINAIIAMNGLSSNELVLRDGVRGNQAAVMRRNVLLYVIIGDPALQPLAPLSKTPKVDAASTKPAPARVRLDHVTVE